MCLGRNPPRESAGRLDLAVRGPATEFVDGVLLKPPSERRIIAVTAGPFEIVQVDIPVMSLGKSSDSQDSKFVRARSIASSETIFASQSQINFTASLLPPNSSVHRVETVKRVSSIQLSGGLQDADCSQRKISLFSRYPLGSSYPVW